ncbi:hypothetical protein GCM10009795_096580 [Nocardioides hankookensis]|uniref:Uncharacterized protein n=1 Tax=Nocardioides hankookensis TaxID=443157 RepID=A0ABW1LMC2_9ACTN
MNRTTATALIAPSTVGAAAAFAGNTGLALLGLLVAGVFSLALALVENGDARGVRDVLFGRIVPPPPRPDNTAAVAVSAPVQPSTSLLNAPGAASVSLVATTDDDEQPRAG